MSKTRTLTTALALALALGMMAGPSLADQSDGQGEPDRADSGNSLSSESEPLRVIEVLEQTSDPSQGNFEEEFTFYKVTYQEVSYDTWVYREPARLGGDNFVLEGLDATSNSFWYGVSAPDENGIQHEIVHQGQAIQYFDTSDGWESLTAQFDNGELLDVNGVEPQ